MEEGAEGSVLGEEGTVVGGVDGGRGRALGCLLVAILLPVVLPGIILPVFVFGERPGDVGPVLVPSDRVLLTLLIAIAALRISILVVLATATIALIATDTLLKTGWQLRPDLVCGRSQEMRYRMSLFPI